MEMNPTVQHLVDDVINLCHPEAIYLFSIKVNLKQEITGFKFCMVADVENKDQLERQIYLQLDCELPYDLVLYTTNEWKIFSKNESSFAHSILEKGWKVYDKTPQ